ncbi:MAG: PKD domain protein, partial [Bacteroidia bacterium]|nr:PKD domain protein [Bacteroidia bacterium]
TDSVGIFDKVTGSETWAGLFFDVPTLDLDTYSTISIKTWSPKVGAVLKFKIENADASITHEADLSTTVADGWEELVYDFSTAPAADYTKIVLFFDWDVAGDDSVYYFDDLTLTD